MILLLHLMYLVSLDVVLLELARSSMAEAGLTRDIGRSCFSETDLGGGGQVASSKQCGSGS